MTCPAVVVILTTVFTRQFTTVGILPMSKLVTLEVSQGVQNMWHNRYIQVSSVDRLRK